MEVQSELGSGEVRHLQRCINDLVSLLALPAIWSGGDPSQVLHTLLDALLRMLRLDLVSVSLTDLAGDGPVEIVRIAELRGPMPPVHEICEALSHSLRDNSRKWPRLLRNLLGDEDVSIVPLPLGLQGELGVIIVAAEREDFPRQTEALLLNVAANQAVIGLQEARLRSQQQRIADELDELVAERTAELAGANAELQLQVGLLQHLPVSAWTLKPDGTPDFVNRGWLEYSGQTLDFVRSHPEAWMTAVHPEDRETAARSFWDGVRSGQGFAFETRSLRARDGIYRWHLQQAVVLRDAEAKVLKFVGTTTDIDDQKRAQEKLRRSEALLAQVQGISLTGGFSWRVDAGDFTFSDEAYRIFEFEKDTPVTLQQIASRVYPEDIPLFSERMAGVRSTGGDLDYEIRLRMPDGSVKHVHTISHGVRDHEGRLEYTGAIQDITRRRLSEDALNKARSELTHVNRITSLGVLTASIAHEVSQPLSGIVTNAGTCLRMLAADPPNVEGARETARRTIRDGNRASEVITRLRALYGKKDTTIESVDLNEATREVLALSLSDLQRNGVLVQQELADGLPLVAGNRVQLQQVILNLIRNASDAMSVVDDRPRQLLIRTETDEDDRVRLTVKDAGVGFAPQAADRIFESFYTTKNDGMGIGLSVSRSIIESHQGRLSATLNTGPGATFSFSIPRVSEGAAAAAGNREIGIPDVTDAA
jgi:PAS domain S-box-containing protein